MIRPYTALCAAFLLWTGCRPFPARIVWQPLNEPGVGGALTAIAVHPANPERVLAAGDMLGAAYSNDGGQSWQVTTGFVSWELGEFTFHPRNPEEVWVGTMSGPHRSLDGGRTWTLQREGFPPVSAGHYSAPVQKILFDEANERRLLAFGGSHRRWASPGRPEWGAVWESTDGGENWRRLATIGGGVNITSAVAAPGVLYSSTYGRGVYRSEDGGAGWAECGAGLANANAYQVAVHPSNPRTVWAALDNARDGATLIAGSIFKSTDGCRSWTESGAGLPRRTNSDTNLMSRHAAIAVAPSDPNRLYTSDTSFSQASVWRSDDGGTSWRSVLNYGNRSRWPMPFNNGPGFEWIAVHPSDPGVVYLANQANIALTRDGGESFLDLGSHLVSASDRQWKGRGFSGLVAVNFRFNPARPGHAVFSAMDDGKIWMSDDDLATWRYPGAPVPAYNGGNDAAFAGPEGAVIYSTFGQDSTFQGIAKSSDGGRTWAMLAGPERGLPSLGAANGRARGVYAIAGEPDRAFAVIGNRVMSTSNGGAMWTTVLEQAGLAWLAGSGRTVYATAANGVYRSEDGVSFNLMAGSPREAWRLVIDSQAAQTLYVTKWRKADGGLWRHRDNRWTRMHDGFYIHDVDVHPRDSRRIAFATSDDPYHDISGATGVYYSDNGGETWTQENWGLAMLRAPVIRFDPHNPARLVLGTAGRGYFAGRLLSPP